ncbi:serine hydrolase domain-containing protein [Stratiformator vulcanicus]|uniref:6-aminohexanoate-dimer hydrolase n=1 Tax=Stratiformator vulcanicus TaxID=2527980 RepID=A0A517R7N7_9PLAN|nr:serine hydrolase [Stratiformator vulcanicus]QDT39885.1 6-aminohexanoate-dimer hydrolase [Stratiformator vulcanicus]
MRLQLCFVPLLAAVWLTLNASPSVGGDSNADRLPRSSPESQGISSEAILEFVNAADQQVDQMHSFMLVRHGRVVAEGWWAPEAADKPHILWSLSKSFTSMAVGLAVEEGKLSIDDKVLSFFPDEAPDDPSANLKAMTVRDLLTMATGHDPIPHMEPDDQWVEKFLATPVVKQPGSDFLYSTPGTFMLSAIVQKVTGETVNDYLKPRLFTPLGIKDPRWDKNPQGITIGGYGLYICTEDIAAFGQFLLQGGKWNGKQLVPEEWVAKATSLQIDNPDGPHSGNADWRQGYGFQFWQCRHNAFRGDGRDGQICLVLPEHDAVIAITAKTSQMQLQLDLIWKHLLPAFKDSPLPEDKTSHARLKSKLKMLRVKSAE